MPVLSREQIDAFWRDGYLMVEDAVTPSQLAALRAEIVQWVEESRAHKSPFGPPTIDGRPRFDMGSEHPMGWCPPVKPDQLLQVERRVVGHGETVSPHSPPATKPL